jgi:hypothetical protein
MNKEISVSLKNTADSYSGIFNRTPGRRSVLQNIVFRYGLLADEKSGGR